ncbi:MAG: NUDIX domain-containing protein [Acidimicrobiales bacterium]
MEFFDDEAPFRQLGERGRFDGGFFQIATGTFVGPDGFTFEREIVRHPGAVCVVALEADGRHVLMIRQYRGAVDQGLLELVAGKRDIPDEDPEVCAARELGEEIGRQASSFREVARFFNSPGFTDEQTICFLAQGLTECEREADGVEEENMTVERVALADVEELMTAGDLIDAKSIIGLLGARAALGWTVRPPAPSPSPARPPAPVSAPAPAPRAPAPPPPAQPSSLGGQQ